MAGAADDRCRAPESGRPTGSTTFLFTDIVGSTRLCETNPFE
jgi:class 3 adenylate cyclase